jgi:hypothetical protein
MPENRSGIQIFTLLEANQALPRARELMLQLRQARRRIVGMQAAVDIEELTASSQALRHTQKTESLLREIEREVHAFHKTSEALNSIGCELKDLEKGTIDFYGLRDNQVVYFCWAEGEEKISHWHSLEAGFQGRQKIED